MEDAQVVSTNDLTTEEIAIARSTDALTVDDNGYGFVPRAWLDALRHRSRTEKLRASLEAHRRQGVPFVRVDELRENPRNPRTGHDVDGIVASLLAFGWGRPLLYRAATLELEAGHGSLLAAKRLELDAVPAIALEHDEREAVGYAIADNAHALRSRWREDVLAEELANADAGVRAALGFGAEDAAALVASVEAAERAAADAAAPPKAKKKRPANEAIAPPPKSAPGDLWILGRHRLIVGDTFDAATRAALLEPDDGRVDLVVTDPPYAIYGSSTGIGASIADDGMVRPFFRELAQVLAEVAKVWAHVYVCCDWRSWPSVWDGFKARLAPKNLIVWDKGGSGLGSNYANAYELVGFFARLPPARTMKSSEARGQRPVHKPNLKRQAEPTTAKRRNPEEATPLELEGMEQLMRRFNRPHGEERNHNAAKPPELFAWFITNSSDEGAVVLDCFAGGGATLEACETLNRSARLLEREPDTADSIVARWVKLTGGEPVRVEGFVEAHRRATISAT